MSAPEGQRPPSVDVYYMETGGGHKATAESLKAALHLAHPTWDVRLLDYSSTGCRLLSSTWMYNHYALKRNMHCITRAMFFWYRLLSTESRKQAHTRRIERMYEETYTPDVVINVGLLGSSVVREALLRRNPLAEMITAMTEYETYEYAGYRSWIEAEDHGKHLQRWMVHTASDEAILIDAGVPPESISRLSGMILHPRFYEDTGPPAAAVGGGGGEAGRQVPAEAPARPRVLLLYGSTAPDSCFNAAIALATETSAEVVCVCGRNDELRFVDNIPEVMRGCDLLVCKPGAGVVWEAAQCGLPAVIDTTHLMDHERANVKWALEAGLAVACGHMSAKGCDCGGRLVDSLLRGGSSGLLEEMRAAAACYRNNGLAETVALLDAAISRLPAPPGGGAARAEEKEGAGAGASPMAATRPFSIPGRAKRAGEAA